MIFSANLTAGAIAGIVIGVLVFIGLIITVIVLCICCLNPKCPCYHYRTSRNTGRVVVVAQQAPQPITITASAKTAKYQLLPTCDPDTDY